MFFLLSLLPLASAVKMKHPWKFKTIFSYDAWWQHAMMHFLSKWSLKLPHFFPLIIFVLINLFLTWSNSIHTIGWKPFRAHLILCTSNYLVKTHMYENKNAICYVRKGFAQLWPQQPYPNIFVTIWVPEICFYIANHKTT